jgi:hypothetical protein
MKRILTLAGCLLGLALPLTVVAQNEAPFAATPGMGEFTIGGGGASNTDFDDSFGALEFSYGQYLSQNSMWALRQSLNYVNPDDGDNGWNGATRLAYDYHLSSDARTRPFVGINAGRIYGENVNDTWTAGLEGGAKFYVKSQTFVYALASYDWLFDRGEQLDDRFDDGRFSWSLGIGYNF